MILTIRIGHIICDIHGTAPVDIAGSVFYPIVRSVDGKRSVIGYLSEYEFNRQLANQQGLENVDVAINRLNGGG